MTGRHGADAMRVWLERLRLPVAILVVNGLLVLPSWVLSGSVGAPWLAGEALLVLAAFWLLRPGSRAAFVGPATAGLLVLTAVLLLADTAARLSLSRPLNLYLDWHLSGAVWLLLSGAVGKATTAFAVGVSLAIVTGLAWGLGRMLNGDSPGRNVVRVAGACGVVLFVLGATWWGEKAGDDSVAARTLSWPTVRFVAEQVEGVRSLLEERARFAGELARAPGSHVDVPDLLGGLEGRTVVLAFIESYGMTVLDDPRYSSVLRPRLEELGRRTEAAGLHLVTGSLVAPTQGGQSWFSHGSLLSGLWLDSQAKYDVLLTTDRETLVDDFRRAGYATVALMPAITLAWPEGAWFGYDRVYAHRDIEYAGPPLNWVTMPDQFTWSFFERTVKSEMGSRPLFAELGLISSHAPWTPILPVLEDWGSIGDGSVFAAWEGAGERPEELWRDVDRVRGQFALSVDYAVHAVISYAERFVDDRTILLVLGDHQPAPLITGDDAGRAVPVHVVSGAREVVQPFLEWGFVEGPFPAEDSSPRRMDAFREWFVEAYSGSVSGRRTAELGSDSDRSEAPSAGSAATVVGR